MVAITARPPITAASTATGSLPARVTGPSRQNQGHNAINTPAFAGRALAPTHSPSARSTSRTSAAPGAAVLTATDRVRKSIDRNYERRSLEQRSHDQAEPLEQVAEDPLERLSADLTALSLQHAAAMATAAAITTPAAAHNERPQQQQQAARGQRQQPPQSGRQSAGPLASAGSVSGSTSASAAAGPASTLVAPSASTADSRRFDLGDTGLPAQLLALRDPACPVALPPPGGLPSSCLPLDNWKLDKLVLSLSANKATWRRSLLLFEWLKAAGHQLDDRLCTTLIRVCSDHGDSVSALAVYDWMTGAPAAGGAGLEATPYTYTAAMRAALAGGLTDRALSIWNEAWRRHTAGRLQVDCRLCITYLELCTRLGLTDQALAMYATMRGAPAGSRMAPTVHAYTAAMRAATEGGRWYRALEIWADMRASGCEPTGHAYSAAISACAAAGDWRRAVSLFDEMTGPAAIRPDVVSCTALITALAAGGEADRSEAVVAWMLANGVRPNARTYTALMAALGNAKRWGRAVEVLGRMQTPDWGGVQPNAYTYSALLKSLGEHGQWQLAEAVFSSIERQVLGPAAGAAPPAAAALSLAAVLAPSSTAVPSVSPLAALFAQAAASATASADSLAAGAAAAAAVAAAAAMTAGGDAASLNLEGLDQTDNSTAAPGSDVGSRGLPVPGVGAGGGGGAGPSTWTRPSQLNGLSLDLLSAVRSGNGSDAAGAVTATAANAVIPMHDVGSPSRKSFSLFSHPPAAAASPSSASSSLSSSGAAASSHVIDLLSGSNTATTGSSGRSSRRSSLTVGGAAVAAAAAAVAAAAAGSYGHQSSSTTTSAALTAADAETAAPAVPPTDPWRSALDHVSGGVLTRQLHSAMDATTSAGGVLGCGGGGETITSTAAIAPPRPVSGAGLPSAPLRSRAFSAPFSGAPSPAPVSLHFDDNGHMMPGPMSLPTPPPPPSHPSHHAHPHPHHGGGGGVLNEVVCGALMLAYERAGKWQEAVGVLLRAMNLGIAPNTVMYNTAISAAGKAGQLEIAEKLYSKVRQPDTVTHETMIAAYGMAGLPDRAEAVFSAMTAAGLRPRDFAFCGLIAAHSLAGNWDGAMRVRARMRRAGVQPSVDVYNALLAACERAGQPDRALELFGAMRREGVEANALTGQLLALVGRQGVRNVESQQVAAAALSAAVAAYGTLLMQTGLF